MERTAVVAGLLTLLMVPLVAAKDYVPGRHRADGLYVPPHFRGEVGSVHAAEAWYEALRLEQNGFPPLPKAPPPAAAGAPPAAPIPPDRTPG